MYYAVYDEVVPSHPLRHLWQIIAQKVSTFSLLRAKPGLIILDIPGAAYAVTWFKARSSGVLLAVSCTRRTTTREFPISSALLILVLLILMLCRIYLASQLADLFSVILRNILLCLRIVFYFTDTTKELYINKSSSNEVNQTVIDGFSINTFN